MVLQASTCSRCYFDRANELSIGLASGTLSDIYRILEDFYVLDINVP
jgi:hypothetical protein